MEENIKLEDCDVSTGNIFEFLGLPNADEMSAKADLSFAIADAIKARKLTQSKAAKLVGESQGNMSLIIRGRLERFSSERLMRILRKLGMDVTVIFKPTTDGQEGALRVEAQA